MPMFRLAYFPQAAAVVTEIRYRRPYQLPACIPVLSGPPRNVATPAPARHPAPASQSGDGLRAPAGDPLSVRVRRGGSVRPGSAGNEEVEGRARRVLRMSPSSSPAGRASGWPGVPRRSLAPSPGRGCAAAVEGAEPVTEVLLGVPAQGGHVGPAGPGVAQAGPVRVGGWWSVPEPGLLWRSRRTTFHGPAW